MLEAIFSDVNTNSRKRGNWRGLNCKRGKWRGIKLIGTTNTLQEGERHHIVL